MEVTAVACRRWTAEEVLSQRAGLTFPPVLLGTSAVTQILADVAQLEPVSQLGLPDAALHRHFNTNVLVGKLVRSGIVTKLTRTGRFDSGARTTLIMNREHPAFAELRELVRSIAVSGSLDANVPGPDVSGMLQYPVPATVDLRSLFGTPRRTLAIVLAHLRPGLRIVTIRDASVPVRPYPRRCSSRSCAMASFEVTHRRRIAAEHRKDATDSLV